MGSYISPWSSHAMSPYSSSCTTGNRDTMCRSYRKLMMSSTSSSHTLIPHSATVMKMSMCRVRFSDSCRNGSYSKFSRRSHRSISPTSYGSKHPTTHTGGSGYYTHTTSPSSVWMSSIRLGSSSLVNSPQV